MEDSKRTTSSCSTCVPNRPCLAAHCEPRGMGRPRPLQSQPVPSRMHSPQGHVTTLLFQVGRALHTAVASADLALAAAIQDVRAQLEVAGGGTQGRDVEGAALLDSCRTFLDALEALAHRIEELPVETARRERLAIASQLYQSVQRIDFDPPPVTPFLAAWPPYSCAEENKPAVVSQRLPEQLTQQELNVLRLLATGAGTQEIADALTISPTTAKKHICNLMDKLGVSDRLSAVLRGQELGLVRVARAPRPTQPR